MSGGCGHAVVAVKLHVTTLLLFYNIQVALERLRVLGEVNCPAFVDVSGKVACSVEQLNLILQTAAEEDETDRCKLLALVWV